MVKRTALDESYATDPVGAAIRTMSSTAKRNLLELADCRGLHNLIREVVRWNIHPATLAGLRRRGVVERLGTPDLTDLGRQVAARLRGETP